MINIIKIVCIVSTLLFTFCAKVDFNNPLDANGTNFNSEDTDGDGTPDVLEDDNHNGIPNKYDPDSDEYEKDSIAPVFQTPANETDTITLGDNFQKRLQDMESRVKATDNIEGDISKRIVIDNSSVSSLTPGKYPIIYTVKDLDSNTTSITRYVVTVDPPKVDTIPPKFNLFGDDIIYITIGETYSDAQITAWDDVDGSVTVTAIGKDKLDLTKAGTYTITYKATDKAGNPTSKIKTIIVEENAGEDTPPTIKLNGDNPMTIKSFADYKEPGCIASDKEEGDLTKKVVINAKELEDASGLGTYKVHYTVKDSASHTTTIDRTVRWIDESGDVTKPVLSVAGDTIFNIKTGNSWTLLAPKVTAYDNVDKDISSSIIKDSKVDTSKAGTYYETYTVSDKAGNSASIRLTVIVADGPIDNTKPVITIKGKVIDTVSMSTSGTYKDSGATASDDGKPISYITTGSVNLKIAGTYKLTYTATDASNNSSSIERTVVVIEGSISNDLLVKYGVPAKSALATINGSYTSYSIESEEAVSINGMGNLQFNWSGSQFYSFRMALNADPWSLDLSTKSTNTLSSPSPSITLTGTKITNLDGEYYVTTSGTNLIWVRTDGSFAIIWKP